MAPLSKLSEFKDAIVAASTILLERRYVDPISHTQSHQRFSDLTERNAAAPTSTFIYSPGGGTKAPETFNNKALFGLFGILGAAMVVVSIWFFFWAKNGGFVWRKGDWEDYKSTVLRRKGKDGKTLSNATKSTKLGQKSIAGTFDLEKGADSEKGYNDHFYGSEVGDGKKRHKKHGKVDDDVRAYRKEKVARVGGINREADGSHFDYTNTDRSEISSQPLMKEEKKSKKKDEKKAKKEESKKSKHKEEKSEAKKEHKSKSKDERKGHKSSKSTDRLLDEPEEQDREERRRQRRAARHAAAEGSTVSAVSDWSERYSALSGSTLSYVSASQPQHAYDATSSYYDNYRPAPPYTSSPYRQHTREHREQYRTSRPSSHVSSNSSSRQSSPRKREQAAARHSAYVYPSYPSATIPEVPQSDAGFTNETGTRSYPHPLSSAAGGGGGGLSRSNGFRRSAPSRTDTIADSDGDLGTLRSFRRG